MKFSTYLNRRVFVMSKDTQPATITKHRLPEASKEGHIRNTLRKHIYSNILRILLSKNENSQMKHSSWFHISAQNIDCGYSLEHRLGKAVLTSTHNLFMSRNKKSITVYPCNPQFYFIKVGFKGSNLYRRFFVMKQ